MILRISKNFVAFSDVIANLKQTDEFYDKVDLTWDNANYTNCVAHYKIEYNEITSITNELKYTVKNFKKCGHGWVTVTPVLTNEESGESILDTFRTIQKGDIYFLSKYFYIL